MAVENVLKYAMEIAGLTHRELTAFSNTLRKPDSDRATVKFFSEIDEIFGKIQLQNQLKLVRKSDLRVYKLLEEAANVAVEASERSAGRIAERKFDEELDWLFEVSEKDEVPPTTPNRDELRHSMTAHPLQPSGSSS